MRTEISARQDIVPGRSLCSALTLSSLLGGGVSNALIDVTTGPSRVHTTMLSLLGYEIVGEKQIRSMKNKT